MLIDECNPHKNSKILYKIDKTISKFIKKHKTPWTAKQSWRKKNNVGGVTVPVFTLTIAHAKSTKAHWSKNTKENHKYKSTQLWPPDFPPKTHCRGSWALQQTVLGKLGINVQRNAVRSIAILNKNDSKIESKWTLHLIVRPGTLQWSREKN